MKSRIFLVAAQLVILVASGCKSLHAVRFAVEPSALDYAQFRRTRIVPNSGDIETVRLDLSGSGYLEKTTGRSERVSDSFWQQSEAPDWQDLRRDHLMLSDAVTTSVFQRLVDAGIFDLKRDPEKDPPPHELAVLVSVRFKKKLILTGDPEYHQIFNMLLDRFNE